MIGKYLDVHVMCSEDVDHLPKLKPLDDSQSFSSARPFHADVLSGSQPSSLEQELA